MKCDQYFYGIAMPIINLSKGNHGESRNDRDYFVKSVAFGHKNQNFSEHKPPKRNKSIKFEFHSLSANNLRGLQPELKRRKSSKAKYSSRASQLPKMSPIKFDKIRFTSYHTTYGIMKREKRSKKRVEKPQGECESVPREVIDKFQNPFYYKLEEVNKKVREYVRLFGTKSNIAKMKRIRSKLRTKKKTFLDEVITGDSLAILRQSLLKIEQKKQYEKELQDFIREAKLSERLFGLKSLQNNGNSKYNSQDKRAVKKIRVKKLSTKRSKRDLVSKRAFKDHLITSDPLGAIQSRTNLDNVVKKEIEQAEEDSSDSISSKSFETFSQETSQEVKHRKPMTKRHSGSMHMRFRSSSSKLFLSVAEEEPSVASKKSKSKVFKKKKSKSPLLKSHTSININSLLDELVNHNPFEMSGSLMTIEEVKNPPKPSKKSNEFNLIIKKVQKEPEKTDKVIFHELYKYYPNSRLQKRLEGHKAWTSRSPDKDNNQKLQSGTKVKHSPQKRKVMRVQHKFDQKDLTLEPPKQLKLKPLASFLMKTTDSREKSTTGSEFLSQNMNHRCETNLKERQSHNFPKNSSSKTFIPDNTSLVTENVLSHFCKEATESSIYTKTLRKDKFPSIYRSSQSKAFLNTMQSGFIKKNKKDKQLITQKLDKKLRDFL
ncbi:unnamed protein product [Moneuplotes crassus]|uniref:Uncharacterized protein n=1 Tax=Euplotes crassus TaxID=5936 RepID=A0AAD2D7Z1_EUPCR|nr:unnamed protein product [Moneuplotes crassus]